MLYDVDIAQLKKLDSFVGNQDALDSALGNKLDALGDEERFINAARTLFGREVEETLLMLKEGQPGYRYAREFDRLVTMHRATPSLHTSGPETDDAISRTPKVPDLNEETRAARPQQPL